MKFSTRVLISQSILSSLALSTTDDKVWDKVELAVLFYSWCACATALWNEMDTETHVWPLLLTYINFIPNIDIVFVCRKHSNRFPCTGGRVNANYSRNDLCARCQPQTLEPRTEEHLFAIHFCVPEHSAMTHPLKTDWHQPNVPKYCNH